MSKSKGGKGSGINPAQPAKPAFNRAHDGKEAPKPAKPPLTPSQINSVKKLDQVLARTGASRAEIKSAAAGVQFNAQAPDKLGTRSVQHKPPAKKQGYQAKDGKTYVNSKAIEAAKNLERSRLQATATKTKVHIERHTAPAPSPVGGPANKQSGVTVRSKSAASSQKSLQQQRAEALLKAARANARQNEASRSVSQQQAVGRGR